MKESYTSKKRVRKNFGKIDAVIDMPSLIEVQTGSYSSFINSVSHFKPDASRVTSPETYVVARGFKG